MIYLIYGGIVMSQADYSEKIRLLQAEAKKCGLRTAIVNYLTEAAANCPNQQLPNGLSVEDAADAIIKTSQIYTKARDAKLSLEEMRQMIAENIVNMDGEQAISYLTGLHVLFGNIGKERNPDPTPEQDQAELPCEQDKWDVQESNMSVEEQVDELVATMPRPDLGLVGDFIAGQEFQEAVFGNTNADVQPGSRKTPEKLTWEQNAIHATVMYAEAAQGNISTVQPHIDPGILTVSTGAYTDTMRVKLQLLNNEITEQEAYSAMNDIESAMAVGLAAALGIALAVGAIAGGLAIGAFLVSAGLILDGAVFVANLIALIGVGFGIELYEQLEWRIQDAYHKWKQKNWRRIKKAKQTISQGMTTVRNAIRRWFS